VVLLSDRRAGAMGVACGLLWRKERLVRMALVSRLFWGVRGGVVLAGVLAVATAGVSGASAGAPATRGMRAGVLAFAMGVPLANFATDCPTGVPSTSECFAIEGEGLVRGLGSVREHYLAMDDQSNPSCRKTTWSPVVLTVDGKGTIDATLTAPGCDARQKFIGVASFTITGGTGAYAGVSGSGTENASDLARDVWSGTLAVPGLTFDTTAPVIHGAVSKAVRVGKTSRRSRVRYKVSAMDAVDGPVKASCSPRSGTLFKIGRTRVICSATDSSANTATAVFTINLKAR